MPSVEEAARGPTTNLAGDLQAGVDAISLDQTIFFEPYIRLVLPLDGYVFWVKQRTIGNSGLFNLSGFNEGEFNEDPLISLDPAPFQAKGSLHYKTRAQQGIESSSSRNQVIFTAEEPVQNLNSTNPSILYIASFDGPMPGDAGPPADTTPIRFAFSSRNSFYQQAGLWHYEGSALYSEMSPQVVDDPRDLLQKPLIISNSLPAWLAFNGYDPPWPVPVSRPNIPFYPSFLVPPNIVPPYGSVHIDPGGTDAWQTMPTLGPMLDQYQLAKDHVAITLFGCNNDIAQSLLYALLQYSFDTEVFGILNIPVVRDEKEGQVELQTLAQKKRITFEVSYNQSDIRNVARQLIESCTPTVQVGDEVISS